MESLLVLEDHGIFNISAIALSDTAVEHVK